MAKLAGAERIRATWIIWDFSRTTFVHSPVGVAESPRPRPHLWRASNLEPSRISRPPKTAVHWWLLAIAGGLAFFAAALSPLDLPLAILADEWDFRGEFAQVIRLSEAFGYGGAVVLIILLAAMLDTRRWRVVPWLAATSISAGLLADVVKLCIARTRPRWADLDGFCSDTFRSWLPVLDEALRDDHQVQSFPSAHTATAIGLAIALSVLYPRGRWIFFVLAVLAGVQRIDSQSHFLSDVLAGAAVGCFAGATCHWLFTSPFALPKLRLPIH